MHHRPSRVCLFNHSGNANRYRSARANSRRQYQYCWQRTISDPRTGGNRGWRAVVAYDVAAFPQDRRPESHSRLQQGQPASASRPEMRPYSHFCRSHRSPCQLSRTPPRHRCAAGLRGMDVIAKVTRETGPSSCLPGMMQGGILTVDKASRALDLCCIARRREKAGCPESAAALGIVSCQATRDVVRTANDSGSNPRSGGIASSQAKWR
jgi:hypothetical protein